MEALILEPADKEEADLIMNIAKKMRIKYAFISDEDKEDYGLAQSMLATDDTKRVSEQSIISKLTK